MSSRSVPRVARARPTEGETRLVALASIEARRARIAAATAKLLEVPASKNHMQSAARPRRQTQSPAPPPRPSEETWMPDTNLFRKASYLKRPATPRFARQAGLPIPACRDGPDPLGQNELVVASEETLTLHKTYGRSYLASDPAKWDQSKIPCDLINGERLSRKGRPQRRLRFREGDVTSIKIVSRWMSEVAEEDESELEEEFEPEEVYPPEKMPLPKKVFDDWEDDSYDWAQAIKDSLEKKIF